MCHIYVLGEVCQHQRICHNLDTDLKKKLLIIKTEIKPQFCFARYPIRNVPPERITNALLLCAHEKFHFNPGCEDDVDGASEM